MKRLLATVISVFMIIGMLPMNAFGVQDTSLIAMEQTENAHWAAESADRLKSAGALDGGAEHMLDNLDGEATRAQAVSALVRSLTDGELPEVSDEDTSKFSDTAGHAAESEILAAVELGYVGGYPDGTFRPDATITRAEIAKITAVALGLKASENASNPFTDLTESDWEYEYVLACAENGLIKGYADGSFRADGKITCGESIAVTERAHEATEHSAHTEVKTEAEPATTKAKPSSGISTSSGSSGGSSGGANSGSSSNNSGSGSIGSPSDSSASSSGSSVGGGGQTVLPMGAASSVWDGSIATSFDDGDGESEETAYKIVTGAQLAYLAKQVNAGTSYSGKYFVLVADIVLNDTSNWDTQTPANSWTPIGTESNKFSGTFDGDGHVVRGMYINKSEQCQGLFGYAENATIKNVGVVESYINGGDYVGGVVARSDSGTVSNCYNTGGVTGTATGTGNSVYAGGVVGRNYSGTVSNCYNTGDVTGTGSNSVNVGGVVGYNTGSNATVSNCYNTGDVTGTGSGNGYVGGVVGYNYDKGTVSNCYSTGAVTGKTVGGVVGYNRRVVATTVSNCYYLSDKASTGVGSGGSAEAKDETYMKTAGFVSLLDTDNETPCWKRSDRANNGFPILAWQCEHSSCTETVTTEPTCTATGVKTYTCTVCGYEYTETIAATGHDYQLTETVAATCTEDGVETYTCSKCNDSYDVTIPAPGHDWEYTFTVDEEPTCTKAGSKSHHCKNCDAKSDETEIIPQLPHSYDEGTVTTEPTCTEDGVRTFTCTECGHSYTVTIPAPGHDFEDKFTVDVEPTCTSKGSQSHHCTRCTEKYDVTEIEMTAHSYDEGTVTTEPTCTEDGVRTFTCTECGHSYTVTIPAPGHDFEDKFTVDVEPTCTSKGSQSHHCIRNGCDEKTDEEEIPALGHDYQLTETVAATCTEAGVETYTCSHSPCTDSYTKMIPATGHSYDEGKVTTEATCTEAGVETYTCSVCKHSEPKPIAALGHDWEDKFTVDVEPTCTSKGSQSHHCIRNGCDEKTDEEEIPVLGHDYQLTETVAATCTEAGEATYTCSVCRDSYTDTISALGHEWSTTFTVDVAPTCTSEGSKSHHCTRCDEKSDVTEIAAPGHSYTSGQKSGITTYTCDTCGDSYSTTNSAYKWYYEPAHDGYYVIQSDAEFGALADLIDNDVSFEDETIKLSEDITVTSKLTIGSESDPFEGTFDGCGYTVTIENGNSGLFGAIGENGKVCNLTVAGAIESSEGNIVGGIANISSGRIINCVFEGQLRGGKNSTYGGICGENSGEILVCLVRGMVESEKTLDCTWGFVAGSNNGTIDYVYYSGKFEDAEDCHGTGEDTANTAYGKGFTYYTKKGKISGSTLMLGEFVWDLLNQGMEKYGISGSEWVENGEQEIAGFNPCRLVSTTK